MRSFRVGTGFDIHAFSNSRSLRLGGVEIPDHPGLLAHSDGDALLHALTDALLGAMGEGDIGEFFSDKADENKGRDSADFVRHARGLMKKKKMEILNIDITIMTETPGLKNFKPRILSRLSEILGIKKENIALKAKRMEGLGAIGRKEGLAVLCTVLLSK